jgi:hypothetical protein
LGDMCAGWLGVPSGASSGMATTAVVFSREGTRCMGTGVRPFGSGRTTSLSWSLSLSLSPEPTTAAVRAREKAVGGCGGGTPVVPTTPLLVGLLLLPLALVPWAATRLRDAAMPTAPTWRLLPLGSKPPWEDFWGEMGGSPVEEEGAALLSLPAPPLVAGDDDWDPAVSGADTERRWGGDTWSLPPTTTPATPAMATADPAPAPAPALSSSPSRLCTGDTFVRGGLEPLPHPVALLGLPP